jgi:hypothetical protein
MSLKNWRLEQLLWNRKKGSLKVIPWPALTKCIVLKPFTHRGQGLLARDQFKHVDADVIELEAAEAKELQSKGLAAAARPADRFKCGSDGITGWRPWAKNYAAPTHDWEGRGGLDAFDDCMVRVSYIGPISAIQLCPGLSLSAADEPIYFPFGWVRALGGYHCEDDPQPVGSLRVYLDELAPHPAEIQTL